MAVSLPSGLRPTREIPGPPPLSLLGALRKQVDFYHDPIRFMYEQRARYGDLARFENRLGTMLFAIGPQYNRELYGETDLFHSRPFVLPGRRSTPQYRLRQSIFS